MSKGFGSPSDETILKLVSVFQAMSDMTRCKVIFALTERERSVNDIASVVGVSQSAVSHHLRRLRDSGLVTFHRHGNQVFYTIDDIHIAAILAEGLHHIEHKGPSAKHLHAHARGHKKVSL